MRNLALIVFCSLALFSCSRDCGTTPCHIAPHGVATIGFDSAEITHYEVVQFAGADTDRYDGSMTKTGAQIFTSQGDTVIITLLPINRTYTLTDIKFTPSSEPYECSLGGGSDYCTSYMLSANVNGVYTAYTEGAGLPLHK